MTKISLLGEASDLNGDEQVVLVKDGVTRRAAVSGLVGAAAAPHVTTAQLAASTALAASNFYGIAQFGSLQSAIAAGELGTAVGHLFSVDDGAGNLVFRAKTPQGSVEVAQTVTPSALGSPRGTEFVGHKAPGAGALDDSLPAILNRAHVWPEQYATMQQAFNAAAARRAQLWFQPNKTYQWPNEEVVVSGKVIVHAQGARIECAHALTALTFSAGADGSRVFGGAWVYTGPKPNGFNALSNGIWFKGTRNGPGQAPTFLSDVGCEGATFSGWGSGGLQFEFTRNSFDLNVRCSSAGYYGVFCFSVDLHRSSGLFVNGLSGQVDGASPEVSELNAYGFTATALTGATGIDRVRDPLSRDVLVENGHFLNIPTWHAIDGHGPDSLVVRNCIVLNCRRGVVFTGLTEQGTLNCLAQNVRAVNMFAPNEVNPNGTSKKGEAFWDIGPSAEHRNKRSRFENCSSFGHGSPTSGHPSDGLAAVTIANTEDGYYNIEDDQSFRAGWSFGSNITRASIKARTVDTRSATVNPSVARIDGDNIDLRIIEWTGGKRNPGVDTNVMVNGLLIAHTNQNCAIKFETFDLTDCTAGEIVSTSGTTIAAALSGNVTLPVTLTATGMTTAPSCSATVTKSGRKVTIQIPANGVSGISTGPLLTLTGLPATYWPNELTSGGVVAVLDGGNYKSGLVWVSTAGVLLFTPDVDSNTSTWAEDGLKGIRGGCIEYVV